MRKFNITLPGPRAKFRSMVGVPGAGLRLKQPNPVSNFRLPVLQSDGATPGTKAGRALTTPVRFGSRPVVMLYGLPLDAIMNGLMLMFHGSGRLVPITARCRTSPKLDGPYSARTL